MRNRNIERLFPFLRRVDDEPLTCMKRVLTLAAVTGSSDRDEGTRTGPAAGGTGHEKPGRDGGPGLVMVGGSLLSSE